MENRGENRERNLQKSVYYSESYFRLSQLCSFAHQIRDVYRLKPANILEIGIGNGFTSSFLRRAGFEVVTVDINPALEPDICSSIAEFKPLLRGRVFDLVVCCEVLEHMPFENFSSSIEIFHSVGQRLYLTLPNYRRVYGLGGFLQIPKLSEFLFGAQLEFPNKKVLDQEHFWEVGSSPETTRNKIRQLMQTFYSRVVIERYSLNPYHLSFQASDNEGNADLFAFIK